ALYRLLHLFGHRPLMIIGGNSRPCAPIVPGAVTLLLTIDAVCGKRQRDQALDRDRPLASETRTVFANIKPRERLVNKPELFFLAGDQAGMHFDISARARQIHLVGRRRFGLLFLIAPELL